MPDVFEYDVFLSFASADEKIVKPIWQDLCQSGLRVFWSPSTLKAEVGNSWFDLIQSSLEKSRHLLLVCSRASMASDWVKREYSAFLSHCHKPRSRLLVPLLVQGYKSSDLPLFIKNLEAWELGRGPLTDLIAQLGGVDIEKLRSENQSLKRNVDTLVLEKLSLEDEVKRLSEQLESRDRTRRLDPPIDRFETEDDDEPFSILGLPTQASSDEIARRYDVLKAEYEGVIRNSPRGLRAICESRLQSLERVFSAVFDKRKREEDQELEQAFETLQLPRNATAGQILTTYNNLIEACVKAERSSDSFIREAAAKELARLQDAIGFLKPIITPVSARSAAKTERATEVVMPQMGESITEGTITKWLKKEGERVDRDEPLFEISTDKVDAEIPSPDSGILTHLLAGEGDTVQVNTVVALIKSDQDDSGDRQNARTV